MIFLQTVFKEMTKGNFSFAILVFGVLQFIVMVDNKRNK